jgi:hypothetical protein
MNLKEVMKAVQQGAELFCRKCTMFDNETEECTFGVCEDPLHGPTLEEVATRLREEESSPD